MTGQDAWQARIALCGVALAVLAGLALRLADPLGNPVLPAEDSYTHVALVREHVRDGNLDALDEGGGLYPPGMHAFVATLWGYTGADLADLSRFAPALLGAIGILGVAAFLWRVAGPLPAWVGAVAMAVLPEAVFRNSMLAPTALDLALLPFLLLAILETVRGRLGWAVPVAVLSLFQLVSHPWLFAILLPAGAAFLFLALLLPWPRAAGPGLSATGLAAAVAILGASGAAALAGCWGTCGSGFAQVVPQAGNVAALAPWLLAATLVGALALAVHAPSLQPWLDGRAAPSARVRWAATGALALLVLAVAWRAHLGLPDQVDPVAMVGLPLLALACLAVVALPWIAGPAGHTGAALALATVPVVVFDPLDSPYWPHRTVAYLGLAIALLAGASAAAVHAWAASRTAPHAKRIRRATFAAAIPPLLVGVLGTGVYAGTTPYEDGWYRLYRPCEMGALEEVARMANREPAALVVAGSWQGKLALAAFTVDTSRVWYSQAYFASDAVRAGLAHRTVYVVIEPHLANETPAADVSFLAGPGWTPVVTACPGEANATVSVYLHRSGASP